MVNMISERHHLLTFPRKRHGAASSGTVTVGAFPSVGSRLVSSSSEALSASAVPALGRVALFRAQLCSSLRRSVRGVFPVITEHSVAVRLERAGLSPAHCFQFGRLPNNSLVPTPVTNAPLLSVGSGAAQLKR
jgi:hypothetical protein